ncbi:helix-turn-helix transcriptional regulator [Fulvivirgaceae bacterium BMA12]|uniref:Helix-turn-helix transcriptional regulator n=1 Tax=Agaribacillus aureus TaxID=3051825 RepID=A0ABT8LA81_9BACT|nr:helix-turn-helix transcriptional regulator [Fulvivirgaceae bacterium BMA12]
MKYEVVPPPPSLARFVRFFWVMESEASRDKPFIYRAMADGCAELIFHYRGRFVELTPHGSFDQSYGLIHSQTRRMRRFITHQNFGIFGVYLYPYALNQLCAMPSSVLSDEMPDLTTLWGGEGIELTEKMMLAENNPARMTLIISFLDKKLNARDHFLPPATNAIQYLIHRQGNVKVTDLAQQYCLSMRQFERNFKLFSGFSPKLYARIIRFQAACQQYGRKDLSLTEIGLACGYYDQSHFIHDFKEFSGYHPGTYFSGKAEGTEYRDV